MNHESFKISTLVGKKYGDSCEYSAFMSPFHHPIASGDGSTNFCYYIDRKFLTTSNENEDSLQLISTNNYRKLEMKDGSKNFYSIDLFDRPLLNASEAKLCINAIDNSGSFRIMLETLDFIISSDIDLLMVNNEGEYRVCIRPFMSPIQFFRRQDEFYDTMNSIIDQWDSMIQSESCKFHSSYDQKTFNWEKHQFKSIIDVNKIGKVNPILCNPRITILNLNTSSSLLKITSQLNGGNFKVCEKQLLKCNLLVSR